MWNSCINGNSITTATKLYVTIFGYYIAKDDYPFLLIVQRPINRFSFIVLMKASILCLAFISNSA